uniref:Uncharacterized protein n=2 Tax=Candidatus Kentrum sp. FW TaxID=2126338 RepID=A0A450RU81_9GAMM|nr:MAG: hypothetical protein BECKFW1821A_GA0114235_100216 [Candidatus Kentron sp. FW]
MNTPLSHDEERPLMERVKAMADHARAELERLADSIDHFTQLAVSKAGWG